MQDDNLRSQDLADHQAGDSNPPKDTLRVPSRLSQRRKVQLAPLEKQEVSGSGLALSPISVPKTPMTAGYLERAPQANALRSLGVIPALNLFDCKQNSAPLRRSPFLLDGGEFHNQFELLEMLGSGTISVVKKAKRIADGVHVAVKCVRSEDEEVKMFTRAEFELMRTLRHPSIICVKTMLEHGLCQFIVMELCEDSVDSRVRNKGAFTEEQTRNLCMQMFQGINYLHWKRVVHRDIKPDNLLLLKDGTNLKITDFNSAKQVGVGAGSQMLTDRGTREYAAPELRFGRIWNERIDVWSSGLSVYFMLQGDLPFNIQHAAVAKELVAGRLPEIRWSGVSSVFKNLLLQCLTIDFYDRPAAMQILLHPAVVKHEGPGHGDCVANEAYLEEVTEGRVSGMMRKFSSRGVRRPCASRSLTPSSTASPRSPGRWRSHTAARWKVLNIAVDAASLSTTGDCDIKEAEGDSPCWTERHLHPDALQNNARNRCVRRMQKDQKRYSSSVSERSDRAHTNGYPSSARVEVGIDAIPDNVVKRSLYKNWGLSGDSPTFVRSSCARCLTV